MKTVKSRVLELLDTHEHLLAFSIVEQRNAKSNHEKMQHLMQAEKERGKIEVLEAVLEVINDN